MKYQTPILVTFVHLVLFWWMGFEVQTYQPPPPKRLAVQTVQLAPATYVAKVSKPAPQKKVVVSAPKKVAKVAPKKSKHVVAKKKPTVKKTVGAAPRQMEALAVEAIGQPEPEDGYRHGLVQRIQNNLTLPEQGEVQLKLTLDRGGKVKKVLVTKAQSERNRVYIEARLADLQFPDFGVLFKNQKEYTFLLSLTHD